MTNDAYKDMSSFISSSFLEVADDIMHFQVFSLIMFSTRRLPALNHS